MTPHAAVSPPFDSLYVHIPFCERKCVYCDFYSIEATEMMERFLRVLEREIAMEAARGEGTVFRTIFFGGGTPSLMTPSQLESVLGRLRACFTVAPDAEITVETNPGTVTPGRLAAYLALGVNRLSIGIQSFDPAELQFLTRIHDRDAAIRCVEAAREAGFASFSIDLIYALPEQSPARWLSNLRQALALEPPHLSAYGLIVEDGTPLAKMVAARQVSPAPAEREAELYTMTMEILEEHGYEHYEVSNYAKPGHRSLHNLNYWKGGRYIGFGPSAHSFWHPGGGTPARRWWNVRDLTTYMRRVEAGASPVVSGEALGSSELLTERVFLGLRSDGLDLSGTAVDERLVGLLVQEGLVTLANGVMRLTRRGFPVCDEIAIRVLESGKER
jgi:oxygen-independent coproporphyrinogen III oxidase